MTQRRDLADPGNRIEFAQVNMVPLETDVNIGLMGSLKANKDFTEQANTDLIDLKEIHGIL